MKVSSLPNEYARDLAVAFNGILFAHWHPAYAPVFSYMRTDTSYGGSFGYSCDSLMWIKSRAEAFDDDPCIRDLVGGLLSMWKPMPYSPIKLALSRRLGQDAAAATSFDDEHRLVEATLAELEALADGLPNLPPRSTLEALIVHLRDAIPAHCRHEENVLARGGDFESHALKLIRSEHEENVAIGEELAERLEDCLDLTTAPAAESLGQLARQYFLLMRRHMAWEGFALELASALREAD